MIWKSGRDKMLWKCCPIGNSTKRNNPIRIRHTSQQYILYVMTMKCDIPRDFLKYNTDEIHTITHSPLDLLTPLARKNTWMFYHYQKNRRKVPRIPPRYLSECYESEYKQRLISVDHGRSYGKVEKGGGVKRLN